MAKGIAAVTGGSGMVGRKITQKLLQEGYEVRILTRNKSLQIGNAQIFVGNIEDARILRLFLENVSYLFHCAAELHDESKMWNINVLATEKILNLIPTSNIRYFCYLSSAGVTGLTNDHLVDENSKCDPQNAYEKSKWAAEVLVAKGFGNCSTVILRPTDVVDDQRPGALSLPLSGELRDRLVVFLKGNECAHIVHAEDVADAAIYFINSSFEKPACFFVSCDHEKFNKFGYLWEMYKSIQQGLAVDKIRKKVYMPIIVPYLLRRLWRGAGNYGDVCYSSEKLLSTSFRYRLGVEGAVRSIAASQCRIIS
jgi:nucleoside-diphosphate-sugar epimerase